MLLKRWKLLLEVMADTKLNASALRVMTFLLNRENSKTKALFPSHARLAADTKLSDRSVRRGLDNLIEQNYIVKLKKGCPGRATSYQINYQQRTVLSKIEDRPVKNMVSNVSDQSTNESIYKSRNLIEATVNNITKNFNPHYKAAKEGKVERLNSTENIASRLFRKTQNPSLVEQYTIKANSTDFQDKADAERIAKFYQCLK